MRIWQNIARQGYKCVNYNLALAYYYGIGVDKNVNQALEYLKEVKDYDNKAYDLLSIITKTKGSSQNPGFRMELNLDDVKGGSILEAEWKYINIKSHHIYQEFNRELKEIIDIYKANPSKESYFWLSRLYRELKYENNEAISEYYFEKSIAAGHLYAKYIKDSCDKELAFSNYDLYLPYNLHDILDSSSKADNECIRWNKINIVCRILQYISLKLP